VAVRFRLGELLEQRKESGDEMSQSELSRRSGVSLTTINAMVNNKTKQVSLATIDALCGALAVEPGELLERDVEKPRRRKRA
jgi:putative transcriptional regulator